MITAAGNEAWPGDVEIKGSRDVTGLPIPSIVRTAKVATVEVKEAAALGRCPKPVWRRVEAEMQKAGIK